MAPRLIVVGGLPGTGKSTIADAIAAEFGATVASFDWLMAGLRTFDDLWPAIELPVERQREIGRSLLSRVAEQQLRRGSACVLDLVARAPACEAWQALAARYDAAFHVIECVCSEPAVHRRRVEGRVRGIPGWYELTWPDVERSRARYVPLPEPKLVLDAVDAVTSNLEKARHYLNSAA